MHRASPFQSENFDSAACSEGFSWLCAGFVMIALSLNLNRCDILPDFVGWGLMAIGFARIAPSHPMARILMWTSAVMVFVSLAGLLMSHLKGPFTMFWTIAISLAEAWTVWQMCGIVVDIARIVGDQDLKRQAKFRRTLYAVALALLIVAAVPSPVRGLFGLSGGILLLISLVLILMLLFRAKRVSREYVMPKWAEDTIAEIQEERVSGSETSRPTGD